MANAEIEIFRTVTVVREENATVELDIPKRILDDEEALSWIDAIMEKDFDSLSPKEKAVYEAVTGAEWDVADEDESIEYNEANNLSEDD